MIAENRTDIVKLTAPVHSTSPLLLNNVDDEDDVISSGHNYESKLKPLSPTHVAATHTSLESTSNMDEGSDSDNDNHDDDTDDEVSSDGDSDSEPDQDSYDNTHQSTSATTNNTSASNVDTHTSMATNSNHDPIPQSIPPHCDYPMVLCGDFNTLLETECFDSDTGYTPSSLIELMRTGQVCI